MQHDAAPRPGKPLPRALSLGRLRRMAKPSVIVKKYANRRLYDGEESRYVTLDELAGADCLDDEVGVAHRAPRLP